MAKTFRHLRRAGWFYISICFIFVSAVVLVVCARTISQTSEQTEETLEENVEYAAAACENLLTDAVNVLNVNYFSAQYMYERNQQTENINDYFIEQTEYLRDELGMSYLGIYAYIDGEMLFSEPWNVPDGYQVKDRPWYQELKENGTSLTISSPYTDARSGEEVVTIGRMFEDGENLVAVDLSLGNLSELIEEINDSGTGEIYVVDVNGAIEACADQSLIGAELLNVYEDSKNRQLTVNGIETRMQSGEKDVITYNSGISWVSLKPILESWYVVAVIDKDQTNLLALKSALPSGVMVAMVLFIFVLLYLNLFWRMNSMKQENARLSHDMRILNIGMGLPGDGQIKQVVCYIYLLLCCYFLMAFHDNENGTRFTIVIAATIPAALILTFAKKANVRLHGFYMTGCLYVVATMYGLIPDGSNRVTNIFLAAAIAISLYQKMELNIFMLVGTFIFYLYRMADDSSATDGQSLVSNSVTDMTILLIGSALLLIVTAWNRRLQVSLRQKAEEAEEAANGKVTFLANVSHEIRTPLNAILGMNELVLRESRQPHIKEYAMYIKNSGKSLMTILSDVMDLSKLESGKVYLASEPYDFSVLLEDICRAIDKRVREKNLTFTLDVAPDLHEQLRGDEVRMKQIMMNLLTNAVKYTEEGEVRLRITGTSAEGYEHLTIEVSDTGIGMRQEEMDKLFMNFERLDLKRNRSIEGAGLGLPITEHLLTAMGGDIKVSSVYGEGSTFTVTIAQETVGDERIGEYHEWYRHRVQQETAHEPAFSADGARVLVVDDNEVNRRIVEGLLRGTGLIVDGAANAEEGIAMIRAHTYHLLLIDYLMPGMDGAEMLAYVREMDGGVYREIPAIAITANVYAGAKEEYQRLGFDDYLGKPIDTDKFDQLIKTYLPKNLIRTWEDKRQMEDAPRGDDELPVISGVDTKKGLSYIGESLELYISILKSYADGGQERIVSLDAAKEKRDLTAYDIVIHGIKGTSASIGADHMAQTAAELEAACAHADTAWTYIDKNHSQAVHEYRQLLSDIKKWLANMETNGKIEEEKITDEAELLERINDMKAAIYAYREKEACVWLRHLYDADVPRVNAAFGAAYRGTLDKLYIFLSDYEMDKAYELAEKLEADVRRIFCETDGFGD